MGAISVINPEPGVLQNRPGGFSDLQLSYLETVSKSVPRGQFSVLSVISVVRISFFLTTEHTENTEASEGTSMDSDEN